MRSWTLNSSFIFSSFNLHLPLSNCIGSSPRCIRKTTNAVTSLCQHCEIFPVACENWKVWPWSYSQYTQNYSHYLHKPGTATQLNNKKQGKFFKTDVSLVGGVFGKWRIEREYSQWQHYPASGEKVIRQRLYGRLRTSKVHQNYQDNL